RAISSASSGLLDVMDSLHCGAISPRLSLDRPVGHRQELRSLAERLEEQAIRPRHEGLAAELVDPVEKGGPPSGIEMGRHLVQKQDGRMARHIGDESGMRKDESDQKRLLLAGRAALRLHVLLPVTDQKIAAV